MKTLRLFYIVLATVSLLALSGCKALNSQPTPEQIKAHDTAVELLKAKAFLIKAERLTVQNRSIPSAMENTNFITIIGDNALVQVSPGMSGGPNGVGGFTVRGTTTGYKLTPKDNGEIMVQFHVSATVGSCDVTIVLNSRTSDATAYINNTFRNLKATIFGKVAPIDDSFNKGYTPF